MNKFIILAFLFSSFSVFSAYADYEPAFRKPAAKKDSITLQKSIQSDLSRFYSLLFKKGSIQVVKNTAKGQKLQDLLKKK